MTNTFTKRARLLQKGTLDLIDSLIRPPLIFELERTPIEKLADWRPFGFIKAPDTQIRIRTAIRIGKMIKDDLEALVKLVEVVESPDQEQSMYQKPIRPSDTLIPRR